MSVLITGDAWDLSNADKPTATLDPDDIWDIPFSVAPLISVVGYPYQNHQIICGPELLNVSSTWDGIDTIRARFKENIGQNLVVGQKYSATFRIILSNGESRDKTLYFKIKER